MPRVEGTVGSSPVACLSAGQHSRFDGAWTCVHANNEEFHETLIRASGKLNVNSPYGPEKALDLPLHRHMDHGLD